MEILSVAALYDLAHTVAAELFEGAVYPWEILGTLARRIPQLGETLGDGYLHPQPDVWIAQDATVAPSAVICGPCIIDHGAQIRHCSYLRGSVIVGKECVVGNSTEVKNSVLFDRVQIPHFNYCGDSVLGWRSHLGAGAITSNVKSDKSLVTVMADGCRIETGRKKFGAMVGDDCEVGCNSVLCPGTVLGRGTVVYPLSRVRGYVPEKSIFKDSQQIVPKRN